MSIEALVLALVSIVRPTTAAAVWAMLVGVNPRRLLAIYLLAGLSVSLTAGITAVLVVGAPLSPHMASTRRGVVLIVLGVVALLMAVAIRLRWVRRFRPAAAPIGQRPRRMSPAGAATAGVLTHLPGVVYLAALSAIVGTGAAASGAIAQVVVYNLVWFAPALVALCVCVFGTVPSEDRLARPVSWARAHRDAVLAIGSAAVGVWLITTGVSDLM